MGYLEQFARNKRGKEKSEVLTARLPVSLYSEFKKHCDELGLSVSEAVYLLVEREMKGNESQSTTNKYINDYKNDVNVNINSDDVVAATTETIKKVFKPKQIRRGTTTGRFTKTQWEVNGFLPCPICNEWLSGSNFNRHAKTNHDLTTETIFTSDEYKEKILAMIVERKANQ